MDRTWMFVLPILAGLSCTPHPASAPVPASAPSIDVAFSPRGGCTERVVSEIASARRGILIQAYSFTSKPIAQALLAAIKRGVSVRALLDRSNQTDRYSAATFLRNAGVDVRIDAQHAIAHNKIMIIDDATILTGSFNFTKQAEQSNAENMLVIKGHLELVRAYEANWQAHAAHCETYAGPAAAPSEGGERRRQRTATGIRPR